MFVNLRLSKSVYIYSLDILWYSYLVVCLLFTIFLPGVGQPCAGLFYFLFIASSNKSCIARFELRRAITTSSSVSLATI